MSNVFEAFLDASLVFNSFRMAPTNSSVVMISAVMMGSSIP
jgi:hypothetical protein